MKIIGWLLLILVGFGCLIFTIAQLVAYYPIQLAVVVLLIISSALIGRAK